MVFFLVTPIGGHQWGHQRKILGVTNQEQGVTKHFERPKCVKIHSHGLVSEIVIRVVVWVYSNHFLMQSGPSLHIFEISLLQICKNQVFKFFTFFNIFLELRKIQKCTIPQINSLNPSDLCCFCILHVK